MSDSVFTTACDEAFSAVATAISEGAEMYLALIVTHQEAEAFKLASMHARLATSHRERQEMSPSHRDADFRRRLREGLEKRGQEAGVQNWSPWGSPEFSRQLEADRARLFGSVAE